MIPKSGLFTLQVIAHNRQELPPLSTQPRICFLPNADWSVSFILFPKGHWLDDCMNFWLLDEIIQEKVIFRQTLMSFIEWYKNADDELKI